VKRSIGSCLSVGTLCCSVVACNADGDRDPVVERMTFSVVQDNGQNLNGQNLNGQNLNGQNLNGQNLNGQNLNGPGAGLFMIWTALDGILLDGGQPLDGPATLASTIFSGTAGGLAVSGTAFSSAEMNGMRGDGRTVRLRVRHVTRPATGDDVWRYYVDYREIDNNWYPICSDQNGARAAIPLNGIWDHHQGVAGGGAHLDDRERSASVSPLDTSPGAASKGCN
jgi:hypothetical protein